MDFARLLSVCVVAAGLALGGEAIAADTPAAATGTGAPAASPGPPTPAAATETAAAKAKPGKPGRAKDGLDEDRIVVFNRPIVTFRSTFLGIRPAERAAAGRDRIAGLLAQGGPGLVTVNRLDEGDAVMVDGRLAFMVVNGDVEPLRGESLESVVQDSVRALNQVIAETREARSGRLMADAVMWAAGATVVYLMLLWLLRVIGRAVTRRTLRYAGSGAVHLKVGDTEIVQRERMILILRRVLQIGFWVFALLLTYEWIGYVLSRFPYTRPWGEQLNAFLVGTVLGLLQSMALALPDLLVAGVIFVIARSVNGTLQRFFEGVQSGRVTVGWLDADSARPTRRLASFAVWVFALVMAYPYIPGSDTEAFKGLSVLLGLMLSIGASGIVGQAASGLILMYTRTFRPGEYVRVADHEGTVVEMGMFTTRVRTGLGEELTLPNSLVLGTVTKNYSRAVDGRGFVLDTAVTIGYDAPWRQVHAMLIEAARRTEGVLDSPPPHVFQTALSDFYVEYRLVCQAMQTGPRPRAEVVSCLHANVQDVFNEHGVQIMSPHYLGDPAEPKVVPPTQWYASPAVAPGAPRGEHGSGSRKPAAP